MLQTNGICPCSCLQNGTKSDSQVKPEGPAINGRAGKKGKGTRPKLVVPPKLLLAIEKDKALKDRLKRYYLPIKGSRQVDLAFALYH